MLHILWYVLSYCSSSPFPRTGCTVLSSSSLSPLVPVVCVVSVVPSSCILVSTLLLLFLSMVLNSLSLSCSDILGFSNKFNSIRCSGLCVVNLALFFGISSGNFCTIPWPVFIISLPYISYILPPCILGILPPFKYS